MFIFDEISYSFISFMLLSDIDKASTRKQTKGSSNQQQQQQQQPGPPNLLQKRLTVLAGVTKEREELRRLGEMAFGRAGTQTSSSARSPACSSVLSSTCLSACSPACSSAGLSMSAPSSFLPQPQPQMHDLLYAQWSTQNISVTTPSSSSSSSSAAAAAAAAAMKDSINSDLPLEGSRVE